MNCPVIEVLSSSPSTRFCVEALEERVAPASSLLDMSVALNIQFSGELKNVHLKMKDTYIIVQDNILQVAVNGGTTVGVIS